MYTDDIRIFVFYEKELCEVIEMTRNQLKLMNVSSKRHVLHCY